MSSHCTCITCRVIFNNVDTQRQHYKSDWHRYNLKRKVAELPPVTFEEFQKRVIAQRNKEDLLRQGIMSCEKCKKNFSTRNQLLNHLLSKKHKSKVLNDENIELDAEETTTITNNEQRDLARSDRATTEDMEVDSDVETVDSDEWIEDTVNPVENNNCLFCSQHSRSLLRNLKHMTLAHSFFIPDPEYCVDLRGLLTYLGEKIFMGCMCIWCNDSGKAFQSAEAVRAHMIDKGHCKMLHEGEALAEYAPFYNYSSSYPDAENKDPDAEVEIPELDDNDYQLVLPSGNVIGHRSLMKYYKQNLNPNKAVSVSKSNKLRKIISQYRALGWTDTNKEVVSRKVRDIKYMQRVQTKYIVQMQIKANKLQQHFRPQTNF